MNSKEHDEFLQARKDNLLDTGIANYNGRWTISGVFNKKLDWMDLPNPDDPIEESLAEFVNEVDEPDEGVWTERDEPFIDNDGTTGF